MTALQEGTLYCIFCDEDLPEGSKACLSCQEYKGLRVREPGLQAGEDLDPQVTLHVACKICGVFHRLVVSKAARKAHREGALVQEAFPQVSPGERELFFVSRICPTCWDSLMGPEEE